MQAPSTSSASHNTTIQTTSIESRRENKEFLYKERKARDELNQELSKLENNASLNSETNEERRTLIEMLYSLEKENEQMMKEMPEETNEEMEVHMEFINDEFQKQLNCLKMEEVRQMKTGSRQERALSAQNKLIDAMEKRIKEVKNEVEAEKTCIMRTSSELKQRLIMNVFKYRQRKEKLNDALKGLQECEDMREELEEMILLLREMCDEHFKPLELKRNEKQMKENEEALSIVLADLDLGSNKENVYRIQN